jgi:hypothetical protein
MKVSPDLKGGGLMKIKGFLIEGKDKEELLLAVQPGNRGMFEHLTMREHEDTEWIDAHGLPQSSRTQITMAVLNYLHRLWQMSGPFQVLDH